MLAREREGDFGGCPVLGTPARSMMVGGLGRRHLSPLAQHFSFDESLTMARSSPQLRQARGAVEVLSVSVRFLRCYWRVLLKILGYVLVPSFFLGVLLFSLVDGEGLVRYLFAERSTVVQGENAAGIGIGANVMSLLCMLGSAVGTAAVLGVVRLHEQGKADITVQEVVAIAVRRVGRVIGATVLVLGGWALGGGIVFGIGAAILMVITGRPVLAAATVPASMILYVGMSVLVLVLTLGVVRLLGYALFTSVAAILNGHFIALAVPLFIGALLLVLVRYLFLVVPAQVLADASFLESVRRVGTLIQGHFWQTVGVAVLTLALGLFVGAMGSMALFVLQESDFYTACNAPVWLQGLAVGLMALSHIGSMLIVSVQAVVGAVQYVSLDERTHDRSVEQGAEQLEQHVEQETSEARDASATDQDRPHT